MGEQIVDPMPARSQLEPPSASDVSHYGDRMTVPANGWTWRLHDPTGAVVDPADLGVAVPVEDAQAEAESWLGEHWRELLDRGAASATLVRGDTAVYGPMGLAAS